LLCITFCAIALLFFKKKQKIKKNHLKIKSLLEILIKL
jgi:hypothetical protein